MGIPINRGCCRRHLDEYGRYRATTFKVSNTSWLVQYSQLTSLRVNESLFELVDPYLQRWAGMTISTNQCHCWPIRWVLQKSALVSGNELLWEHSETYIHSRRAWWLASDKFSLRRNYYTDIIWSEGSLPSMAPAVSKRYINTGRFWPSLEGWLAKTACG